MAGAMPPTATESVASMAIFWVNSLVVKGWPPQCLLMSLACRWSAEFKPMLADLAVSVLGPIGAEMQRLVADPAYIDSVLSDGGARARAISTPVMREVFDVVGLLQS